MRGVCGLTTEEIARCPSATARAGTVPQRTRCARRPNFAMNGFLRGPDAAELSERLDGCAVRGLLVFNEGYMSLVGTTALTSQTDRAEIRLGRFAGGVLPEPEESGGCWALIAAARVESRPTSAFDLGRDRAACRTGHTLAVENRAQQIGAASCWSKPR